MGTNVTMERRDTEYVVCFGDSITQSGSSSPEGWVILLQKKIMDSAAGLKCVVHNAGIGGNTTAMALDRFNSDVLAFLPCIVIVEFGINDCFVNLHTVQNRITIDEFKNKLGELIRLIENSGGRPVLVVNHLMIDEKSYGQGNCKPLSENFKPYNDSIRETAEKKQLPIVDMEAMIRQHEVNLDEFLTGDGVHLSNYGMKLYADFIWETLRGLL